MSAGDVVRTIAEAQGAGFDVSGACEWCSGPYSLTFHSGPCPRIASIEYYSNGRVKQVHFFAVADREAPKSDETSE